MTGQREVKLGRGRGGSREEEGEGGFIYYNRPLFSSRLIMKAVEVKGEVMGGVMCEVMGEEMSQVMGEMGSEVMSS